MTPSSISHWVNDHDSTPSLEMSPMHKALCCKLSKLPWKNWSPKWFFNSSHQLSSPKEGAEVPASERFLFRPACVIWVRVRKSQPKAAAKAASRANRAYVAATQPRFWDQRQEGKGKLTPLSPHSSSYSLLNPEISTEMSDTAVALQWQWDRSFHQVK